MSAALPATLNITTVVLQYTLVVVTRVVVAKHVINVVGLKKECYVNWPEMGFVSVYLAYQRLLFPDFFISQLAMSMFLGYSMVRDICHSYKDSFYNTTANKVLNISLV